MRFDSLEAFLHMDGHGLFIWAAYGITFIVLVANFWWPTLVRSRIIRASKAQALRQRAHQEGNKEGKEVA